MQPKRRFSGVVYRLTGTVCPLAMVGKHNNIKIMPGDRCSQWWTHGAAAP